MTSVIYATILSMLMCWLAFNVIKFRRKNKVRYADGDVEELKIARSAHSNAAEYIPISLILLFALEYNGAQLILVHLLGIALVAGRIIHCRGILNENLDARVTGMKVTFGVIFSLAVANLIYLPYGKFLL